MALQMETIRATADRIAASHQLEIVELEFTGGSKHRSLRVFVEKNEVARAQMAAQMAEQMAEPISEKGKGGSGAGVFPRVPVETLSGISHEDCANFARDFGTVLDVEDLIPGAEYTLEVSSPGLERKLLKPADYQRFQGSLAKVQTFTPVANNRHFTGRLIAFDGAAFTLDLSAARQKGKAGKAPSVQMVAISLENVERAHLVAEV
jgi:ribosome maturation factor RimP